MKSTGKKKSLKDIKNKILLSSNTYWPFIKKFFLKQGRLKNIFIQTVSQDLLLNENISS